MKGLVLNNLLLGALLLVAVFGVAFCMKAEAFNQEAKTTLEKRVDSLEEWKVKQEKRNAAQLEWNKTLDKILTDAGYPTKALKKWNPSILQ